jgi:APA family basic amino acid/polyamine antiporter
MLFSDRELFSGRKLAVDAAIAIFALAFSIWAIYGAGYEVIAKGFLLLMLGVPVYVYMKYRESKSNVLRIPDTKSNGEATPRRVSTSV